MELTVKTSKLQDMTARAIKGATNNKLAPWTDLLEIDLTDGVLSLTSSNEKRDYLTIFDNKVVGKNFNVVVNAEIFGKLVAKTTTENIKLTLKGTNLVFKGNGTYTMPLPLDEGELVSFPQPDMGEEVSSTFAKLTAIKAVIANNKGAVATSVDVPVLTGYYVGESAVTGDGNKIAMTDINLFGMDLLLSPETISLLGVLDKEDVGVTIATDTSQNGGEYIVFATEADDKTPGAQLVVKELENKADYPIEQIKELLESEFTSTCKLPKSAFLNVIERLSLFLNLYSSDGITLTFDKTGLTLSTNKNAGASETISYQGSTDCKPFIIDIDPEMLKTQLGSIKGEVVTVKYGNPDSIVMEADKLTLLVASLSATVAQAAEEEVEEEVEV